MTRVALLFLFASLAFGQTNPWKRQGTVISPRRSGDSVAIATTLLDPNAGRAASIGRLDVSAAAAPNAATPLATPVPYTGTELVHPDVQYFPRGWNGYRYWMAVTPLQASDNQYENPSIYASVDGQTWVTPAGLTNPVVPKPTNGYNSDPDLVVGMDGKLYLFWREEIGGATQSLKFKTSTDGVAWSATQTAMTGVPIATEYWASASYLFDGRTWEMYYTDIHQEGAYTVRKRTALTATGPWSDPVTLLDTPPALMEFWHLDAVYVGGRTVLLLHIRKTGGGGSQLRLAWSDNGTAFTMATAPMLNASVVSGAWDASLYRSSMVPVYDGYETKLAIWYSAKSATVWRVGYTEARLNPTPVSDLVSTTALFPAACFGVGKGILCDTFNRADDAAALGNTFTGTAWVDSGGTWGIQSKLAYVPVATNSRFTLSIGVSDMRVMTRVATIGGGANEEWIIFRWSDSSNYWRFGNGSGTSRNLQKIVAGVQTSFSVAQTPAPANGDWLEARAVGDTITAVVNGVVVGVVTDAFNNTATNCGLQAANTTTRVSHFAALRP